MKTLKTDKNVITRQHVRCERAVLPYSTMLTQFFLWPEARTRELMLMGSKIHPERGCQNGVPFCLKTGNVSISTVGNSVR